MTVWRIPCGIPENGRPGVITGEFGVITGGSGVITGSSGVKVRGKNRVILVLNRRNFSSVLKDVRGISGF